MSDPQASTKFYRAPGTAHARIYLSATKTHHISHIESGALNYE